MRLLIIPAAVIFYFFISNIDRLDQHLRYKNLPEEVDNSIPDN
jgi:hypothetical protein